MMAGYERLSPGDAYSSGKGHGWETRVQAVEFERPVRDPKMRGSRGQLILEEAYDFHRDDLNRDGVISKDDLAFRLDVQNGRYRVSITLGDLSQALGSIDLFVNGARVAEQASVWAPGGYRMLDLTPTGWWNALRTTVEVTDGRIRIVMKENQKHYDTELAEQKTWETPYAKWYHSTPILQEAPYHFIGYPFVHHSVMAIENPPPPKR